HLHRMIDHFFRCISEQMLSLEVHQRDLSSLIDNHYGIGGGLQQGPKARFRLLHIVYVVARSDISTEFAIQIYERLAVVPDPAVFPTVVAQPIFHIEWPPCFKRFEVNAETISKIFRMNAL